MSKPLAPRHPKFPIGRVCGICGRGATPRLGGCMGATPILQALDYDVAPRTMAFAHFGCIERARASAKQVKPITLRISATIAREYYDRMPDGLPLDKLHEGACDLTPAEARAVLADAQHNSDRRAVDVGPCAMPIGTFNAYRALAKQAAAALAKGAA